MAIALLINIIRFGGDLIVPPNQVVENAIAVGGDVTIQQGTRVTETAIAIDGDVILEKGVRVDGDAYAVGGEIITEEGATINGASGTQTPKKGKKNGSKSFSEYRGTERDRCADSGHLAC